MLVVLCKTYCLDSVYAGFSLMDNPSERKTSFSLYYVWYSNCRPLLDPTVGVLNRKFQWVCMFLHDKPCKDSKISYRNRQIYSVGEFFLKRSIQLVNIYKFL
jgi:hypothetical protein